MTTSALRHRDPGSLGLLLGATGSALSQTGAAASVAIRVFQFQPGRPRGSRRHPRHLDQPRRHHPHGDLGRARKPGRAVRRAPGRQGRERQRGLPGSGVYPYFCARHPSMRGEVVVR